MSTICPSAYPALERRATNAALLGFVLASSFHRLLLSSFPTGGGIVFVHCFGENICLLAEVLLIYHAILANDEGHHARRPVFCRIGYERETAGHPAVYDVIFHAAQATFPLTRWELGILPGDR